MKRVIFALGILFSTHSFSQTNIINPFSSFKGYSIDSVELKKSINKDHGITYWRNTQVIPDLIGVLFATPPPRFKHLGNGSWNICGDFNKDGWIDLYSGGSGDTTDFYSNSIFLVWNPQKNVFENKNLLNDKSLPNFFGSPHSVYLNDDDYVDIVFICSSANFNNHFYDVAIFLSDGKGGYDLKYCNLFPDYAQKFFSEGFGDIGDLNGDGIPDVVTNHNSHTMIYWGTKEAPYFSNKNYVDFPSDTANFKTYNPFGDIFPQAAEVFTSKIYDVNNDGLNDIVFGTSEDKISRIIINQGNGRFNNKGLIMLPKFKTNQSNFDNEDYIIDELNGDGLNDLIVTNHTSDYTTWNLFTYIQQKDNTFKVDTSIIEYTINSKRIGSWKPRLIYCDFNGDGKKDITYTDDAANLDADTAGIILLKKSVFIRRDNKFIEDDYYKYDKYGALLKKYIGYEPYNDFCKFIKKPIFKNDRNYNEGVAVCKGDTINISITNNLKGEKIDWYKLDGKALSTNVDKLAFNDTATFYVIKTDSLNCKIISDTISMKRPYTLIYSPSVKDTTVCQNITSFNLSTLDNNPSNGLRWYTKDSIGAIYSIIAPLINPVNTTDIVYYVSQYPKLTDGNGNFLDNGCESPRVKITVKINPAPASPSVKDTAYCNNISADTLKASSLTGHSLNWYGTSATGGTASILGSKPTTTTVGSFNYYVSQKNNTTGCEGARAKIGVTINPLPIAPIVRDTNYCNNATSDTIRLNASSGATLLWYGTNATGGTGSSSAIKPSTSTVGAANYYLSQIITATGCEGPRSKVVVTTKPIPSAPALSRDTANFLLSGAPGTTWYKDGSAITDTAQKYKPAAAGSYTAKTTTNGCTSVISAAYYYLVTDIIHLSKDEFIKLAPNPFVNQLNFDFIVKGYQKLNIEVYDVATGSKVATQQNITAGTKIQLGQLARGTYIIRITSNDNKIAHQFKMVKL